MHAPVEWRELFEGGSRRSPPRSKPGCAELCVPSGREPVRPQDGWYRDELEEVLTGKLSQEFQRGTKDPCVFLDRRSGLILLHHIDDIRVAGPKAAVLKFTEVDLPEPVR